MAQFGSGEQRRILISIAARDDATSRLQALGRELQQIDAYINENARDSEELRRVFNQLLSSYELLGQSNPQFENLFRRILDIARTHLGINIQIEESQERHTREIGRARAESQQLRQEQGRVTEEYYKSTQAIDRVEQGLREVNQQADKLGANAAESAGEFGQNWRQQISQIRNLLMDLQYHQDIDTIHRSATQPMRPFSPDRPFHTGFGQLPIIQQADPTRVDPQLRQQTDATQRLTSAIDRLRTQLATQADTYLDPEYGRVPTVLRQGTNTALRAGFGGQTSDAVLPDGRLNIAALRVHPVWGNIRYAQRGALGIGQLLQGFGVSGGPASLTAGLAGGGISALAGGFDPYIWIAAVQQMGFAMRQLIDEGREIDRIERSFTGVAASVFGTDGALAAIERLRHEQLSYVTESEQLEIGGQLLSTNLATTQTDLVELAEILPVLSQISGRGTVEGSQRLISILSNRDLKGLGEFGIDRRTVRRDIDLLQSSGAVETYTEAYNQVIREQLEETFLRYGGQAIFSETDILGTRLNQGGENFAQSITNVTDLIATAINKGADEIGTRSRIVERILLEGDNSIYLENLRDAEQRFLIEPRDALQNFDFSNPDDFITLSERLNAEQVQARRYSEDSALLLFIELQRLGFGIERPQDAISDPGGFHIANLEEELQFTHAFGSPGIPSIDYRVVQRLTDQARLLQQAAAGADRSTLESTLHTLLDIPLSGDVTEEQSRNLQTLLQAATDLSAPIQGQQRIRGILSVTYEIIEHLGAGGAFAQIFEDFTELAELLDNVSDAGFLTPEVRSTISESYLDIGTELKNQIQQLPLTDTSDDTTQRIRDIVISMAEALITRAEETVANTLPPNEIAFSELLTTGRETDTPEYRQTQQLRDLHRYLGLPPDRELDAADVETFFRQIRPFFESLESSNLQQARTFAGYARNYVLDELDRSQRHERPIVLNPEGFDYYTSGQYTDITEEQRDRFIAPILSYQDTVTDIEGAVASGDLNLTNLLLKRLEAQYDSLSKSIEDEPLLTSSEQQNTIASLNIDPIRILATHPAIRSLTDAGGAPVFTLNRGTGASEQLFYQPPQTFRRVTPEEGAIDVVAALGQAIARGDLANYQQDRQHAEERQEDADALAGISQRPGESGRAFSNRRARAQERFAENEADRVAEESEQFDIALAFENASRSLEAVPEELRGLADNILTSGPFTGPFAADYASQLQGEGFQSPSADALINLALRQRDEEFQDSLEAFQEGVLIPEPRRPAVPSIIPFDTRNTGFQSAIDIDTGPLTVATADAQNLLDFFNAFSGGNYDEDLQNQLDNMILSLTDYIGELDGITTEIEIFQERTSSVANLFNLREPGAPTEILTAAADRNYPDTSAGNRARDAFLRSVSYTLGTGDEGADALFTGRPAHVIDALIQQAPDDADIGEVVARYVQTWVAYRARLNRNLFPDETITSGVLAQFGLQFGGPSGDPYTVQPGDTLSEIALSRGLTVEQLRAFNPSLPQNNRSLQIGTTIQFGHGLSTLTPPIFPDRNPANQLPSIDISTPDAPFDESSLLGLVQSLKDNLTTSNQQVDTLRTKAESVKTILKETDTEAKELGEKLDYMSRDRETTWEIMVNDTAWQEYIASVTSFTAGGTWTVQPASPSTNDPGRGNANIQ